MKLIALLAAFTLTVVATQDEHQPAAAQEQHEWLQQLVGEWTATVETTMEPGAEPMMMESTESVRSIGGLWIQSDGSAEYMGTPFHSVMTLGYDPRREAFVGTWVDSMQTHLWLYEGQLDAARKVLTLDTEGPSFTDPTQNAKYRDVIELKGPDHKQLSSSVRGEDGTWTTFMRADYRRKK